MRELKFRAWNEELKRIIPFEDLSEFPLSTLKGDKAWTFEQYTCLKDKNGEEIYEGDIIRNIEEVAPVDGKIDILSGGFNFASMAHYEVIGNTHENKELLEGE